MRACCQRTALSRVRVPAACARLPGRSGETMYIPSCFVAWNGMALDEKTPLLRSMAAMDVQGKRLLANLGEKNIAQVVTYVGWEQEFFVVSKKAYLERPDLLHCKRTLIGAPPARGQQADAHYFGQIPNSVDAYMRAVQKELWLVGVPMVVYHNEVAPGQHELSPIFQVSNVATDQNMVCMEIMHELADKHGLCVLFHEKPFAGINGNGKHNNWSVQGLLSSPGGGSVNLMKPGSKPEDQRRYTVSTSCLAWAMMKHGDVVRCACIGAGNDHRLGAQEAPPAIMSLFPGVGMEAHMKAVAEGGPLEGYAGDSKGLKYGCNNCQEIMVAAEDRNRTAPFPHCGNRFEFRAVGGSANVAHANVIINTALADAFCVWSDLVEGGMSARDATAQMLKESLPAVFTGNGYDPAWPVEAVEKRGLKNLSSTVLALDTFASDKNKTLFEKHGVYLPEVRARRACVRARCRRAGEVRASCRAARHRRSPHALAFATPLLARARAPAILLAGSARQEVEARQAVMFEIYSIEIKIEATTLIEMVNTSLVPACARDLKTYEGTKLAGDREAVYMSLQAESSKLADICAGMPHGASEAEEAHFCRDKIVPQLVAVRKVADVCEGLIEKALYPFPTYAEMLYGHH